jgi:hypothetical protein
MPKRDWTKQRDKLNQLNAHKLCYQCVDALRGFLLILLIKSLVSGWITNKISDKGEVASSYCPLPLKKPSHKKF